MTSRATPAAPAARVDVAVQPTSGARTIANTTAANPAVTVAAPRTSCRPVRPGTCGRIDGMSASAPAAIGMLM
jgi:hypothetical protein